MSIVQIPRGAASKALPHVQAALENLLRAWDALHEAEKLVGFEITTDELNELAGGLNAPDSAHRLVTLQLVEDWLNDIASAPK